MEKASQICNSQFEIKFDQSDIPVRSLHFVIGQCQCIHTLDIKYRQIPLNEKQFYKSFLDLLSQPLPSLRKLMISAWRENYYSSPLDYEQPDLDYLADISRFTGNLPHVTHVKIDWITLYSQLFCNVIMTACLGNKCLERFMAYYDNETGSTRQLMKGVLSLSCNQMKLFMIADCDELCDRDRASQLRQKMLSDPAENNKEINSNFILPQIVGLHLSHLVFFTASEIEAFIKALLGGPLRVLVVNNFQLPYLMPVLLSKGLPELTELQLHYIGITSNEPEGNHLFTEYEAAVCTLPKLKFLEFKHLHGLTRILQNLLKQYFVAVRGSQCLTVLDISGQNTKACLKTLLFPEGLPALIEFRAEDCDLLPVDIYRLGKATQTNRLPSLRILSLSRNPNISNFLCYLFLGTWPRLESVALEDLELTSLDRVFLACSVSTLYQQTGIMPKLNTLFCDEIFIPELKYLVQSGVSISTSNKVQVIFRVFEDMFNDPLMISTRKYNLENNREEVLDKLHALQDRDEKYCCYGVVRQWIIDFQRKEQIELGN